MNPPKRKVAKRKSGADKTGRRDADVAIKDLEERLLQITSSIREAVWLRDVKSRKILYVNPAYEKIFALSCESFYRDYESFLDTIFPEDRDRVLKAIDDQLQGIPFRQDYRALHPDGSVHWIRGRSFLIRNAVGEVDRIVGLAEEISERRQAEEELRKTADRFRSFIEVTGQLGWVTNSRGEVDEDIPTWRRYTGQTADEVKGQGWVQAVHPSDLEATLDAWAKAVKTKSPYEVEYRLRRYDGIYRYFIARGIPVLKDEGDVREWIGTCLDITSRKLMEAELFNMSMTDQLTGLHNRRGFLTLADQQMKLARRSKTGLLLFFCDLDDLKEINDTLGHEGGDKTLIETAKIFKASFRDSDIIARIGGDEFAVLAVGLENVNPDAMTARLKATIEAHNSRSGQNYAISLSLGWCAYDPENPCSVDDLMSRADQRMYAEKKRKQMV